MRRFFIVILCCLLLTTAVSAASVASDLQSATTVSSDGTCDVTLTVQLQLDEVPADLVFPLPAKAKDISLNGGIAKTSLSAGVRNVDLSGLVHSGGAYTFVIHYSLPDAITADSKDQLYLTLDLLSGFAYPIEKMSFTVTLPSAPEKDPEFVSTYHQESVASIMEYSVEGSVIRCSFTQGLKDQESLTMTLAVSEEQFPQTISKKWSLSTDDILMYICAFLALVYWIISLRALPPRRSRQPKAPEGISAGEIGCLLTGQGVDLTAMVVSWAQMGYLMIQLDDNGRVLLHKRMDMGNERSSFENKYFRILFGKRKTVDGTGYHYAALYRKAARTARGLHSYYRKGSGNPNVFRVLAAGIGLFGGISLATALVSDTAWQVILSILLSILGTAAAWQIQSGTASVHLRRKQPLYIAAGASLIWLLLSAWAGEWGVAVFVLLSQWLAGFAAAYGGRRTELGRQMMSDILGLRRFLTSVPQKELHRILKNNPEYFYNLAPYALALGVDKAFARQLGKLQLPQCMYLTTGMDGHLTAREWDQLLRDAVNALDERQQRLRWEKLTGK